MNGEFNNMQNNVQNNVQNLNEMANYQYMNQQQVQMSSNMGTNNVNKKKSKGPIIVIILLIFIIIGMACYIVYDKTDVFDRFLNKEEKIEESSKEPEEDTNKEEIKQCEEQKCDKDAKVSIDEDKAINNKGFKYYASADSGYLSIMYDYDNPGKYRMYIDIDEMLDGYVYVSDKSKLKDTYYLEFDKNVISIEVCHVMVLGVAGATLFFLMEDGTVEYMPIAYAFENDLVKSYGRIEGISQIVNITPVFAYGEGKTALALRADGTYYDLLEYLAKLPYYESAF